MRSHSARCLILLMVVLLVGALAVPAEGRKRPRRYDAVILMDWTLCPTNATLTIGYESDPQAVPDPNPDDTTWPLVDLDAELPGSPGSSLIQGGALVLKVTDVPNRQEVVNQIDDDAGKVVTDEAPLDAEGNPIEGNPATITHEKVEEVRWTQPLDVRDQLRLGLSSFQAGLTYGLFEVVFCPSSPGDVPGGGTPGVTTPGPSLETEEIQDLSNRLDENRDVGRGRDGSLVPRSQCTIVGTSGDDRVPGTPGNDVICGLGGNDVIDGAGGTDIIDGANGDDRLRGGSGNDLLLGLRGHDRLNGNGGADKAAGGAGVDRVRGSSGADRLNGGTGDDRITGGEGRDRIRGASGDDEINARDRTRDRVDGGSGWDRARVDRVGSAAGTPRRADRVHRIEHVL